MKSLSIIVPVYNGEAFLERCVDSILKQTYTDFEIVLVDDGSTDNSLELCRKYEQKDQRIVVLHKQNEGLVAARKSGLTVSKGKYIGFVDCDDYVDDNMYSDLMAAALEHNSDIAIGGIIIDYSDRSSKLYNILPEGFYDSDRIKSEIYSAIPFHSGFVKYGIIPGVVVKVFKREILEKALPNVFDNINIGEDIAITSYSLLNAQSVSIVNSAAYHYIQDHQSMIRGFNPNRFEKICNLYECLSKINNPLYQSKLDLYISYLIYSNVAECAQQSNADKKDIEKYIKQILQNEITRKVLKKADISSLGIKDKVKVFFMRFKMIKLIIAVCKGAK